MPEETAAAQDPVPGVAAIVTLAASQLLTMFGLPTSEEEQRRNLMWSASNAVALYHLVHVTLAHVPPPTGLEPESPDEDLININAGAANHE